MSSRCSFVNVNIGIPACGVVRATNSAALVIPEAAARSHESGRLRARGAILFSHGRVTWRASLLSQREPLFRVANRLGANVAGRNRKCEKRREAEDESQHEQPPPIAPRSACDCKLAAAASRLSPHDVRSGGPAFPQRSCIASRAKKPVSSPTQFVGEAGIGKEHRELPSPKLALARFSRSTSSSKETGGAFAPAVTAAAEDAPTVRREPCGSFERVAQPRAGAPHRSRRASLSTEQPWSRHVRSSPPRRSGRTRPRSWR